MKRFLWVVLALLLPVGAFAIGEQYGRIAGIVYTPEGAEMPNAKVTLTSPTLFGGPRVLCSWEDGSFTFNNLPPGTYETTIEKEGFKTVIHANLIVSIGKTKRIYSTLETSALAPPPPNTNNNGCPLEEEVFQGFMRLYEREPSFWPDDTIPPNPAALFSWDLPMVGQSLPQFVLQLPSAKVQDNQLRLQGRPVSVVLDGVLLPR